MSNTIRNHGLLPGDAIQPEVYIVVLNRNAPTKCSPYNMISPKNIACIYEPPFLILNNTKTVTVNIQPT